jgi:hypothetical protein
MKIRVLVLPIVVALAACGGSDEVAQDPGLSGNGASNAQSAPDTNEAGDPYPTDNIGTNPRRGPQPGNKIANFKFLGYPNGDTTQGLKPVSLAQYFDPTGEKYKLIHIQASGLWCQPCRLETQTVTPMAQTLTDRKVVWLMSIAEGGTPGVASNKSDLDKWLTQFKASYTQFVDPGNANLGPFYDAAAIPWNANISAKTMEILSSATGALATEDMILKDLDKWIRQIDGGTL